ncbi:hypothetical protein H109_07083 [Trichophyton interdigitale MR816]|uniref:Uncharacterized protein n=1 Tax=Trichophyton interdigitale (strain MR816) TaxID=1215338 RepID=A0A059J0C1_TRIIM|nr:hypothetical protein H109_07083 [Trichophyton interdigitale MR816]
MRQCLKGGTNHQGNGIQIELDGIYSLDQRKDWQYSPRLPLFPRQGVAPIGATQMPSSQCGKIPARTKVGTPFDLQTASMSFLRGRRIIHKPKGHNDKVVAWNFRNIIHKSKGHNYKVVAWKFMGTPRIKYTKDQKYTWQLTASSPLTRMAEAGVIEWLIARLHEKNGKTSGCKPQYCVGQFLVAVDSGVADKSELMDEISNKIRYYGRSLICPASRSTYMVISTEKPMRLS